MFALGGTTGSWGGKLANYDFPCAGTRADFPDAWAEFSRVCVQHSSAVISQLGVQTDFGLPGAHTEAVAWLRPGGFAVSKSLMLPPRKKNFTFLSESSDAGTILLGAVVSGWSYAGGVDGVRIQRLRASDAAGETIHVEAREFVVAAGALESTRLILELNDSGSRPILPEGSEVGKGLGDHLSAPIAELTGDAASIARKLFSPVFSRRMLETLRFSDPSADLCGRHFAHVVFHLEGSDMDVLRALIAGIQKRSRPAVSLGQMLAATPGLMRVAVDRVLRQRLYISRKTRTVLQLDVEQQRHLDNSVTLTAEVDRWGRRRAAVNWGIRDEDMDFFNMARQAVLGRMEQCGIDIRFVQADPSGVKLYDAYHPVGTLRAGNDPAAVVDLSFRVRGTFNLFAVSTAVFPTAGAANPTFPMLCVAEEVAQSLVRRSVA
ncbi:MAG: GMC oxidoreductase [Thermoanaerobaculia bacterium]